MDDFWGPEEWERFDESMKRVFPDRPVVEIDNEDAIFHIGLRSRRPVPDPRTVGAPRRRLHGAARRGNGGALAGIYDDKDRVMVAMSFNSDVGDSWEWADDPRYPEKYSALGIRIGVNYVVYAMTH